MEIKRIAARVMVLSVGLLLTSSVTGTAGSGASRLYDQLNQIDRGTEEAVTEYEKCSNYMTWMQQALDSFSRQQELFHQQLRSFNEAVEHLKNL